MLAASIPHRDISSSCRKLCDKSKKYSVSGDLIRSHPNSIKGIDWLHRQSVPLVFFMAENLEY